MEQMITSGLMYFWSESTPMAYRPRSAAASNTPSPVRLATWNTMSQPASYSASASSLPLAGSS